METQEPKAQEVNPLSHVAVTVALVVNSENVLAEFLFCYCRLLHKVSKELAEWYFQDGRAVLAACCHLAVENIEVKHFFSLSGAEEKTVNNELL